MNVKTDLSMVIKFNSEVTYLYHMDFGFLSSIANEKTEGLCTKLEYLGLNWKTKKSNKWGIGKP